MNAEELLKQRCSIRKFENKIVNRETLNEILFMASRAPSWANLQIARYNIVENKELINTISSNGVNGFVYNVNTLKNANNVCILSYKKGKSGKLNSEKYATSKNQSWETFDAGIAAHQFTLACQTKGIGSVIMGVINEENIKKVIDLPEDETVGAIIVYGYPSKDNTLTPRLSVEEIARFY